MSSSESWALIAWLTNTRVVSSPDASRSSYSSTASALAFRSAMLVSPTLVVGCEQFLEAAALVLPGGRLLALAESDEVRAAANDSGRVPVRIALDPPQRALGNAEVSIDPAEFQRQGVQRCVGTGAEVRRVIGSYVVELRPRRVALLAQTRDEHLLQPDPAPFGNDFRPLAEVVQNVGDGLHVRNRVIELVHGGPQWMGVRVDESREHGLAVEIEPLRVRPREPEDVFVAADRHDSVLSDREGLGNRESLVYGDNLGVVEDQIRDERGDLRSSGGCDRGGQQGCGAAAGDSRD